MRLVLLLLHVYLAWFLASLNRYANEYHRDILSHLESNLEGGEYGGHEAKTTTGILS